MTKRIAIVVQRYGSEINGGAELHAKLLAEKLSLKYNVEVLTTTAQDYMKWDNHYHSGVDTVDGISVRRFAVVPSTERQYRHAYRAMFGDKKYFKLLRLIGVFNFLERRFKISIPTQGDIRRWFIAQGPYCPKLVSYIRSERNAYDVFIFFTYLYYPTAVGMRLVGNKSIFIPTAHDEDIMYTKAYEDIYKIPSFIMYNTASEQRLVENNFAHYTTHTAVAGLGITPYTGEEGQLPYGLIPKYYFIYIGRIDEGKGCTTMIESFLTFYDKFPEWRSIKLVLVGNNYLSKRYDHPSVVYSGFVSEGMKYTLLKNARALIMPSRFESLSLVTLEAMSVGVPVIVNKGCEVLRDHIVNSGVGNMYADQQELFKILLDYLIKNEEMIKLEGERAYKYIIENYSWDTVLEKFDDAINYVISSKK